LECGSDWHLALDDQEAVGCVDGLGDTHLFLAGTLRVALEILLVRRVRRQLNPLTLLQDKHVLLQI
jgi:hypothetical protein